MKDRRADRHFSSYRLCYGLLLALCLTASGCATDGPAMSAEPDDPVATPADGADTGTAEKTAEERGEDDGEWRELEPDKGDEAVVVTAWLITTLAGIAAGILGVIALF